MKMAKTAARGLDLDVALPPCNVLAGALVGIHRLDNGSHLFERLFMDRASSGEVAGSFGSTGASQSISDYSRPFFLSWALVSSEDGTQKTSLISPIRSSLKTTLTLVPFLMMPGTRMPVVV